VPLEIFDEPSELSSDPDSGLPSVELVDMVVVVVVFVVVVVVVFVVVNVVVVVLLK